MKRAILTLLGLCCCNILFGWGAGHDVQIALVLKYLPEQIGKNFQKNPDENLKYWAHFPDGHKSHSLQKKVVETLGEGEAAFLDSKLKTQYSWHSKEGKSLAFVMLAKSFRENNYKAAAFYMGCLMHAYADSSAFNHAPLTHMLTYYRYNEASFPKVNLDLIVFDESPILRERVFALLKDFKPNAPKIPIEDILVKIQVLATEDAAHLATIENKLFAKPENSGQLSPQYIEAMAQTAARQTRDGVNLVCAAWVVANSKQKIDIEDLFRLENGKLRLKNSVLKKSEVLTKKILSERKLSEDSVYAGLPCCEKIEENAQPAITFIAEQSSHMGNAKLGFQNRMLIAMAARTLKNSGAKIRLLNLKQIEKSYPSAKVAPIIVLGVNNYIPNANGLENYLKDGGKVLILGGMNANFTPIKNYFKKRPNNETPVANSYGLANAEEIKKMALVFEPVFSKGMRAAEIPFIHNPNTNAGWGKPVSNFEISANKNAIPLINLKYGDASNSYCVCAAFKNDGGKIFALWLPQYLLMPMLFTPQSEQMPDWSRPALDSFSAPVFLNAIRLLEKN